MTLPGLPNPWLILGVAATWAASLVGVGMWQNNVGHTAEKAAWQGQQISELKVANAEIVRLNNEARTRELQSAHDMDNLGRQYEQKLADSEARRKHDVDAARAGALRLQFRGTCGAASEGAGSQTGASSGVGHGETTIELPREITADLYALADDADQVVRQLDSCQDALQSYVNFYQRKDHQ